jgi:hypothetical protein
MTDYKNLGKPSPMPPLLVDLCLALIAIAVIGTSYGLVADKADRMVVMSRAEFERQIAEQRIQAARQAMDARECMGNWRDLFRPEQKRGSL